MRTVLTQTKLAKHYSQLRMLLLSDNQKTIRRWASTKCTPVYITHQMNAQRARLRPAYYSLATAGGANKIRSSTWVLSDTNRLATVQPHSAVHEQTASLQPHPKGLPIYLILERSVAASGLSNPIILSTLARAYLSRSYTLEAQT